MAQSRTHRPALAFAVLAAAAGAALLWAYLRRYELALSGGPPVSVLVALEAIEPGTLVTEELLAERAVPEAYADDRFVRAADRVRVVGMRVGTALEAQQTLLWTDLATASEERADLSALVPLGSRAMTIRPHGAEPGPGLIRPGDYADIIANLPAAGGEMRAAVVLLQRLLVLAIGATTGEPTPPGDSAAPLAMEASTITFSVTLQQAQLLALAAEQGTLMVALRNPDDPRVFSEAIDLPATALREPSVRAAAQRSAAGPIRLEADPP